MLTVEAMIGVHPMLPPVLIEGKQYAVLRDKFLSTNLAVKKSILIDPGQEIVLIWINTIPLYEKGHGV